MKTEEEIRELKSCLREKDKRLSKIETRWSMVKWSIVIIGVALSFFALVWMNIHMFNSLPSSFYINSEGYRIITDGLLHIGAFIISLFSFIGVSAVWIFFYLIFVGEEE